MNIVRTPRRDEEEEGLGSSGARCDGPQDAPLGQPLHQASVVRDADPCDVLPSPDEAWQQTKPALDVVLEKLVQGFMLALKTTYRGSGDTFDYDTSSLRGESLHSPARSIFIERLRNLGWDVVTEGYWVMKVTHPKSKKR
ncbi:MAG TPA: hypothetical protein PKV96_00075 [Candidatus Saccharimonas sp.]|jgi:hypothetical protein|nr:hypothetical protein [Candidatus Saccharimonas sp.]